MVDFWWQNFSRFSPGKIGFNLSLQSSPHSSLQEKKLSPVGASRLTFPSPETREPKKKTHIKKKTRKQNFTGLSRDFWGNFVYVFFSPP